MESVRGGVENSPGTVPWSPSLGQGEWPGNNSQRPNSRFKERGALPFKGLGPWHHPQGVHVKNTVKDLIQWKRFRQLNVKARWGWQNLNTDSFDSSVHFLTSPPFPSSPLAPPLLPLSSPLAPPPFPSSSPLAPPLLPSSSPQAPPPFPSSSPLTPLPSPSPSPSPLTPPLFPSSSPLAPPPLPSTSPLAPPPFPSTSPMAPPPFPSSSPLAPPPLPSTSPMAPPPFPSSSPLAPPPFPSSSTLAPPPLPSTSPLAPPYFPSPPLAMPPGLHGVQLAGVNVSFFQWQIHQEERRLSGLSPDALWRQDEDGDSFLHLAVAQGRRALAFVLARKMADLGLLDTKEHNGQTALQLGVAANQHLIVEDLIGHGAQINTTDSWGRTPLHVSAEKGFLLTLQSLQMALYNGWSVSVEVFNYEGLTPLHAAVLSHNAIVKELRTSAQAGKLLQKKKLSECVKTLLLMGASYGTKDLKSGRSSLYMAAEEANMELLQLFLDQPSYLAIINTKAFNGNTALHVASCLSGRTAQVAAVKLLMRKGADPGAKNLENETPAQLVPEGPAGVEVQRVLKGKDVSA